LIGRSGIAIALKEGMLTGLLPTTESTVMYKCFELEQNFRYALSAGIAGEALSLLTCRTYLDQNFLHTRIEQIVEQLMTSQNKNGSWSNLRSADRKMTILLVWLTHFRNYLFSNFVCPLS